MKRIVTGLLCAASLMTVLLCGCGDTEESPVTALTRDPGRTLATTTTTTVAVPDTADTTTAPQATATAPMARPTTPTVSTDTVPTTRPTASVTVTDTDSSAVGTAIAECAASLVGTPFVAGGNSTAGFDNPSFVAYCYRQSGYTVPRALKSMLTFGTEASTDALQAGDLLLFCEDDTGTPTFAGIYIGGGRFVACKNKDSGTVEQALNNTYWLPRLIAARRAPANA